MVLISISMVSSKNFKFESHFAGFLHKLTHKFQLLPTMVSRLVGRRHHYSIQTLFSIDADGL